MFGNDRSALRCSLCGQGIYRVNGAKSRVEKLCQAFENGKELVELSDHSPHDISNVLKLYLRQVNHLSLLGMHRSESFCFKPNSVVVIRVG